MWHLLHGLHLHRLHVALRHQLVSLPTRVSAKRPRNPFILHSDTDTDPEIVLDEDPVPKPKAKKAKKARDQGASAASQLHGDASIITIDDIDDPRDEHLNKTDPTADIREFFVAVPPWARRNQVSYEM